MSGPGDQLAAHERGPDHARPREQDSPREIQAQPTGLQARLERLPVGHPSSPYRDDGSRKPPPPDLSSLELDLPDETSAKPDQDLATEDKPRVDPDGSWHWKGLDLKPDQSRAADQALAKCRDVEQRLTPAMRHIESQLKYGVLAPDTEQHALKSPDRFKEKLYKMTVRFPGEDPAVLASQIHDGVRYTFVCDTENFYESFWDTSAKLSDGGFELVQRDNKWSDSEYKGVNTRWRDSASGQLFEVQAHTYDSLEAKEWTHAAYERINDTRTPVEEVEVLRAQQREISARVPLPQDWQLIPDYSRTTDER